jgi:hypothetical protein
LAATQIRIYHPSKHCKYLNFFCQGEEAEDIKYANWLSMVHAGVKGLEMFSPASMEWKQAHSQARYRTHSI